MTEEPLRLRVHRAASGPTVIYLPGLHGDWTLVGPFRNAPAGRATFAEITSSQDGGAPEPAGY
jgi:hypothetical protein